MKKPLRAVEEFFRDYLLFLQRYRAWLLVPLGALLLFMAALFLLRGDDLPMYFLYAIF
jgi:hypothetical protein